MTQSFASMARMRREKVLLITDTSLNFMHAYEIYSMRWSIEFFISDSKRMLGLADCFSHDFRTHSPCVCKWSHARCVCRHAEDALIFASATTVRPLYAPSRANGAYPGCAYCRAFGAYACLPWPGP